MPVNSPKTGRPSLVRPGEQRASVERLLADVAAKIRDAELQLDHLRTQLEHRPADSAKLEGAASVFLDEIRELLGDALPSHASIRRAARLALAEEAWQSRLDGLWDTKQVMEVLAVSKQRVSALVRDGRLIALPDGGRQWFPIWQFAGTGAEQRAALAAAHRVLIDQGRIDPWSAASWFLAAHPDLDAQEPRDWIRRSGDRTRLLAAAQRDAARAAA